MTIPPFFSGTMQLCQLSHIPVSGFAHAFLYNIIILMKNFKGIKSGYNIRIGVLLSFLLVFDAVVLGIGVHRTTADRAGTEEVLTPVRSPEATAVSSTTPDSTPEPTPEPIPIYKSMIGIKYDRAEYKAENPDEGFASEWGASYEEPAYLETNNDCETIVANISSTGSAVTSASVSRWGIPFESGKSYTVFLNISSTLNRTIRMRAWNGDSGTEYGSTGLSAGPDMQYYEWSFTVPEGTGTYNGVFTFDLGNNGITDPHTVTIYGFRIIGQDDNEAVRVNQLGYYTTEQKRCTFIYSCGDLFDVVNAETNKIAYTGAIVHRTEDSYTGETNYYGDFTNLQVPGTYFIRSQNGLVSQKFVINGDPYAELSGAALRMLSYQRCGLDLGEWAGALSHPACHLREATLYYTDTNSYTIGGWHDAGDFGRYVCTGTKAVNDLMLAYMTAPDEFNDDNHGPDSGNGIPDVMDEARFEMDWLLRMHEDDGGVFNKVTSEGFPDDFMAPEDDTLPLFLFAADTVSTADACGSFAIAAMAFKDIDAEFAQNCLDAALKADKYLRVNPDYRLTTNPTGVTAGQYLDDSDTDARFTAKMALYAATGETGYLEQAKEIYEADNTAINSVSWKNNGMFGAYLFLTSENGETDDPDFYATVLKVLTDTADHLCNQTGGSAYGIANTLYEWGSNSYVANDGIILAMAYDMTGDQKYEQTALEQLNYLLGKNSLDYCFVAGFGSKSPQHQHNRLTLSKDAVMEGAMSGGPDASREDNITQAMAADTPAAKMYVDDYRSYSTNEVAVYYNSALLYLLTALS